MYGFGCDAIINPKNKQNIKKKHAIYCVLKSLQKLYIEQVIEWE